MKLQIINLNKRIRVRLDSIQSVIAKSLRLVPPKTRRPNSVNIIFVDDAFIKKLNLEFKKRNRSTDVLCFNMSYQVPGKKQYADESNVYISSQKAMSTCKAYKNTFKQELILYTVHGVLHMFGYRDDTPGRKKNMKNLQSDILKKIKKD